MTTWTRAALYTTVAERFWAKVDRSGGPKACWIWTAVKSGRYGQFHVGTKRDGNRRMVYAHRWAYEHLVGPIPEGLAIDHLCRNPPCVNPAHMEPVTTGENTRRGEGPVAVNARKTHCHNGHPFDETNTYVYHDGKRACRPCLAAHARRYKAERRAAQ